MQSEQPNPNDVEYCTRCGTPHPMRAKYCPHCGYRLADQRMEGQASARPPMPVAKAVVAGSISVAAPSSNRRFRIIVAAISAVAVALGGGFLIVHKIQLDQAMSDCMNLQTTWAAKSAAHHRKAKSFKETDFLYSVPNDTSYGLGAAKQVASMYADWESKYVPSCTTDKGIQGLRDQIDEQRGKETSAAADLKKADDALRQVEIMEDLQHRAGPYRLTNAMACESIKGRYSHDPSGNGSTLMRLDDDCTVHVTRYTGAINGEDFLNNFGDLNGMIGSMEKVSYAMKLEQWGTGDYGMGSWQVRDGDHEECLVAAAPGVPMVGNGLDEQLGYVRVKIAKDCSNADDVDTLYLVEPDAERDLESQFTPKQGMDTIESAYEAAYKLCAANAGTYRSKSGKSETLDAKCGVVSETDGRKELAPFDVTSFAVSNGAATWGTSMGPALMRLLPAGVSDGGGMREDTSKARISPFVIAAPSGQSEYDREIMVRQ